MKNEISSPTSYSLHLCPLLQTLCPNEHSIILTLPRKLLGPLLSILLPPFPHPRLHFPSPRLPNIQTLLTRLAPVTFLSAHRECSNLFLFPSMFRLRRVEMEVGESEGLCLCRAGIEGGECLAAGRVSLASWKFISVFVSGSWDCRNGPQLMEHYTPQKP